MRGIRRGIAALFALLLLSTQAFAAGESCPVPENALHEAVLKLARERGPKEEELLCEGHWVMGSEETQDTVTVYADICYFEYGFMADIFTDVGSGAGLTPVKLTFTKPDYSLMDAAWPEEGMNYVRSIREMLPEKLWDEWNDTEKYRQMLAQVEAQASAYVRSIGRTEPVMDWRLLDPPLELSEILVSASNMTGRFWTYPLWVTWRERMEEGERYRYERLWQPDGRCCGVTYTREDGTQYRTDGDTGVETLRKTRLSDGAVVEEITIDAQPLTLTVKIAYPLGTRTYRLRYDGREYMRESIEDTGSFALEEECAQLFDADVMRLAEWREGMAEPIVTYREFR